MDFTVALAQIKPKLGCLDDNLLLMESLIEKGISEKVGLILFPELALTGYFLKDLVPEVAISLDSPRIVRLKKLSQHISIAFGCVEVSSDYRYFNAALYVEKGEIRHVHRKVYLPTYGLFDEQRYLAQGDMFRAFNTQFGRMGMLICEDMWHISSPYILSLDGSSTILCLSSSPGRGLSTEGKLGSTAAWQKITSLTAMLLHSRVLFCNRVGFEDGVNFWGGSEVVDPSGEVTVRAKMFDEDFVVAKVEEEALRRARIFSPVMRDENIYITMRELQRIEKERGC